MTPELMAYYTFDDVADKIVRDSSGNGNDAVLENGASISNLATPRGGANADRVNMGPLDLSSGGGYSTLRVGCAGWLDAATSDARIFSHANGNTHYAITNKTPAAFFKSRGEWLDQMPLPQSPYASPERVVASIVDDGLQSIARR